MKSFSLILGIIVAIVFVALLGGCNSYNRLNGQKQQVDKSWADVQNVYQRRADLIPNLVKTVEGAANFEKSTLTDVVQARQQVTNLKVDPASAPNDPQALAQFQKTQDQLSGALSRLLVVIERYPDLKATANFRDLQAQLEGTENRITVERGRFNEAVVTYNTSVNAMPARLYAGAFGFQPRPYFAAREGSDVPPPVSFDFGKATPAPAR
ncbi:MAG: LemA family protein [Chthoniobacteraceae bacterium]